MATPNSKQEAEDTSTEFILKMVANIPLENPDLISQTMQRCRLQLDGWPGASRLLSPDTLCPSCSTPWLCGQYRAELRPRPTATKPLRRLSNKRREGRPLGRLQTRLLERFLAARDMIVLECKRCGKETKLPIRSRSDRGKSVIEPAQSSAQVTPKVTSQVTPGVTPSTSGRRRSRARVKNAGLVIPASLRTPRTPVAAATPAAAAVATATMATETPDLGQSPATVRLRPVPEQLPPSDASSVARESPRPGGAAAIPIPLKKSRGSLPGAAGGAGVASVAVPLKRSQSGRAKGAAGGTPSPVTPAAGSARERQRRLQKILSQADCRTSDTGLMAFLSEL